jgi:hypothetical protein
MKSLIIVAMCIALTCAVPIENENALILKLQQDIAKGIFDSILSILPSPQDLLDIITHPTTVSVLGSLLPVVLGRRSIDESKLPELLKQFHQDLAKGIFDSILSILPSPQDLLDIITHPTTVSVLGSLLPVVLGH